MRSAPAAVAVILLVSAAAARAAITVTLPPDRPVQLLAKKDKELLPVVAVKVRQPLVDVDGKLRGAGRETLRLAPGQRYAAGSVLIRNPRIIPALSVVEPTASELGRGRSAGRVPLQADGGEAPLGDADSIAQRRSGAYDQPSRSDRSEVTFECVLAPDRPLEDCFLAVIVYAELERVLRGEVPLYEVYVAQIGRLDPEQPRDISFGFKPARWVGGSTPSWIDDLNRPSLQGRAQSPSNKDPRVMVAVFSRGQQVYSTGVPGSLSALLDLCERAELKQAIARRVTAGADGAAELFRPMPFVLAEDLRAQWAGRTVEVDLAIDAEGNVTEVSLPGSENIELTEELAAGLRHWLFLPEIRGGEADLRQEQPVPQPCCKRFRVPL